MIDVFLNFEVVYYGVIWEIIEFIEGVKVVYDFDINLVCCFDCLFDDNLFYDVIWYVDDIEVLKY